MTHSIIVLTMWVTFLSIILAYIDYRKIQEEAIIYKRSKNRRGFYVLFMNVLMGVVVHYRFGVNWVVVAAFSQVIYWFVFDLFLNLFRGLPVTYTSNNGKDHQDALTDRIFNILPKKYSGVVQILVKALIIGLCINYFIHG